MMLKLKVLAVATWLIFTVGIFYLHSSFVDAQTTSPRPILTRKPDMALINKFDNEIRARFLSEPFFGVARIAPTQPVKLASAHLSSFSPKTSAEMDAVKSFVEGGWDVGIYLYGRRAEPKVKNGKAKDKYAITYRVNQPVTVTGLQRPSQLQDPKNLVKYVKEAFLEYQNAKPTDAENFQFDNGDWSYVARPVRVVSESCLRCHNDYVVIDKLSAGQFKLRKRGIGDVNGILLYAFRRHQ